MPNITVDRAIYRGVEKVRARWRDQDSQRTRILGRADELSQSEIDEAVWRLQLSLDAEGGTAPKLSAWVETYWDLKALADETRSEYSASFRLLTEPWKHGRKRHPGWADRPISTITRAEVSRLARMLESRFTLATARKHLRHAKALFGLAVKTDRIGANPVSHERVEVPKRSRVGKDRKRWQVVSFEDTERAMKFCGPDVRALAALARYAALRFSEAAGLMRHHWRDRDGVLEVHLRTAEEAGTKQGEREVPVSPRLAEVLEERFAIDKGPIFTLTHKAAWWRFTRGMRAAGMTPWPKPFHTLRDNCCVEWARHPDIGPATAAHWTGHDLKVFMARYHEESQDELDAVRSGVVHSWYVGASKLPEQGAQDVD